MGHSCRTLLWDTPVGHTLRTRLPPKVTLRGCKTSVSYETSSKSHASSLKNERFVRESLQKSHVKSPKRALRTRLPPKVTFHENSASMPHPATQIPMARPHPTPQKHDSPNANPNGTTQHSADLTKRCACAAKGITFLAPHLIFMQITME